MPSIRSPSCSMTDTCAWPHHRSSVSPSTSLDQSGNRAQKCKTVNTQQPRNEGGQEVVNASQHLPPSPSLPTQLWMVLVAGILCLCSSDVLHCCIPYKLWPTLINTSLYLLSLAASLSSLFPLSISPLSTFPPSFLCKWPDSKRFSFYRPHGL